MFFLREGTPEIEYIKDAKKIKTFTTIRIITDSQS